MKKNAQTILIPAVLILLCSLLSACTSSKADNENILKKYTPVQIINLYVDSLNAGDYATINKIMSKNFLADINEGKGYSGLPSLKISDVRIKPLDSTGLTPEIAEQYQNIPNAVSYYELNYTIDEISDTSLFGGTGEHLYFVKLVQEGNMWKIDALSSSP